MLATFQCIPAVQYLCQCLVSFEFLAIPSQIRKLNIMKKFELGMLQNDSFSMPVMVDFCCVQYMH